MSLEAVRAYLAQWNRDRDIIVLDDSTATVALAAAALSARPFSEEIIPARIAKTISLKTASGAMLIVAAGDVKIDNRKFKDRFGFKPRMLSADEALQYTGHAPGGVCPFALPPGVEVYPDISLKRFSTVFPACGSSNSCIELSPDDLALCSGSSDWVEVCSPISAP